jgi:beta-fructofuranosidase
MHPDALYMDSTHDIWGGSIVVDKNNTSGFFPNQTNGVVAIYTQRGIRYTGDEQAIAYSTDSGYTFTRYAKNPVIRDTAHKYLFRHPKVIWHQPTERWVMSVAKTFGTIGFYTSPNLLEWTLASDFQNKDALAAGHWFQYANLVPIPRLNSTGAQDPNLPTIPGGQALDFGDWILLVSSRTGAAPITGSGTRYFPGTFNGTHFEPLDNHADRFIDFGPRNYESHFFFGLPDGAPVVSLGLASNYQFVGPTRAGSDGMFTGPREGYLIPGPGEGDLSYFSHPVGLDALKESTLMDLSVQQDMVNETVSYNSSSAILVEAWFVMQPPDENPVEINLDFIFSSSPDHHEILCTIIFKTWSADFGCNRMNWTINAFLNQMSTKELLPILPFHNPSVRRWEVQAILDQSILEVYLNGGVQAGTITLSPISPLDTVHLKSRKIPEWAKLDVKVQTLRP